MMVFTRVKHCILRKIHRHLGWDSNPLDQRYCPGAIERQFESFNLAAGSATI